MKRAVVFLMVSALAADSPELPDFQNIAAQAGLVQSFPNGGTESKKYIVETTGSGVAFIDYNNDGLLDIFLLSGPGGTNRLYRNEGNGHFTDVTKETGLRATAGVKGSAPATSITTASLIYWSRHGAAWLSTGMWAAADSRTSLPRPV